MTSPPVASPPSAHDPVTLRLLTDSLRASGSGRINLRGDSMVPTLRDGWKLLVRSVPAEALHVGEIVAFFNRGVLTVHRLVWKKVEGGRECFIFQGDNSPARETVESDAILGRVEGAEGDWNQNGLPIPIPVGKDERAFFYRNAYRVHSLLAPRVPWTRIPGEPGRGRLLYHLLRASFRLLERIFAPRPRRRA